MTEREWLEIGYSKNLIDSAGSSLSFGEVYKEWFRMKMGRIKPQSLDRIEVTYNKYYAHHEIISRMTDTFCEEYICSFLNSFILSGAISKKEYKRIYQIVNNVLCYSYDLKLSPTPLINWELVHRYSAVLELSRCNTVENAIPEKDKQILLDSVIKYDIYPEKRSASLALCLNFFLGLRVGELAALTFHDFDIDNRLLTVSKTEVKTYCRDSSGDKVGKMEYKIVNNLKTRRSRRTIPLCDSAIVIYELIMQHHAAMQYQDDRICFDGVNGIMVRSLDRVLRRLCGLCRIEHINSHRIRKTFASDLHYAGVPTRIISDLLGHSELETTEKYYILDKPDNNPEILNYLNSTFEYKRK